MNENELKLLRALHEKSEPAETVAKRAGLPVSAVMSLAASLEQHGLAEASRAARATAHPTPEGKEYLEKGLPERRLCQAVVALKGEALLEEAAQKARLTEAERNIALPWAKRKGWLALSHKGGATMLACKAPPQASPAELALEQVGVEGVEASKANPEGLAELQQRGLVKVQESSSVSLKLTAKGKGALAGAKETIGQLTPDLLKSGGWRDKHFRPYDLKTAAAPLQPGKRHFYERFLDEVREALVGLGFREVNGSLTETEFWNMDALFMAQDHPARDIHDVFYIQEPSSGDFPDARLVERVRHMHEEGSEKSKGWRYKWSAEVAKRLIARSHDTGITARELAKGLKPPQRVFFLARVFRPDEIDWKHMVEFTQLGGFVIDERLNFRELVGYLKTFALDVIGAEEARVVPSYYPFTEPSADLVVKVPGRGWMEAAGAGIFRPEMLEALGVETPVLAWGIGIDRLATIKLAIEDIRQLHTTDVNLLRSR
jgi:phenylalanyl-tRNA synthetase alpha chain